MLRAKRLFSTNSFEYWITFKHFRRQLTHYRSELKK